MEPVSLKRIARILVMKAAGSRYESRRSRCLHETDAMITLVRLSKLREFLRMRTPVEFSAVHNDAADRRAMASDELGSRFNNNVSAVLDWSQEVRCRECVIDNDRDAVPVRDLRDTLYVNDLPVRVTERLDVKGFRVRLYGVLKVLKNERIHEVVRIP